MFGGFKQFLLNKGAVKSQYIPFYMKWVSDCYTFFDSSPSARLSSDQKKQFLSHMAKQHEEWQVKQADTALRLYDYFLSREYKALTKDAPAGPAEFKSVEEKMRKVLRLRQRSYSTEKTYLTWIRSFLSFIKGKPQDDINGWDLQDFLSYLAVERKVSPSTQNLAINALVFFFRHVLEKEIGNELSSVRARQRRHLPVVLTEREVQTIFDHLSGTQRLMAMLIYGCGLRLQECLSLRIKDIDLEQSLVIVRSGKGDKDRRTVLPDALKDDLIRHIAEVRYLYDQDRKENVNGVGFREHLKGNIPMPAKSGDGSGSSRQSRCQLIHGP